MDSSAIFGFAGVLVGAASSYFTQRGSEERRDRALVRAGVRLLLTDASKVKGQLQGSLTKDEWWRHENSVVLPHWEAYQAELARGLLLRDWLTIRGAFVLLPDLQESADLAARLENRHLRDGGRENVVMVLTTFEAAEETLTDLTLELQSPTEKLRARLKGKSVTKD